MSYVPANNGFAKYFFAMLDDKDRNSKYSDAIKACIQEFIAKEGREPTVLDIGIGTGMLSCLCIKHGAKHVTGVDTNSTMFTLAKRSLAEVDPTGKKFTVKLVGVGPSQLDKSKKFDMIVSEILGTLTTSESMYKYVSAYLGHLNVFGGDEGEERVYVVPRTTTQYFSVVSYDRAAMRAPLASALEHAIHSSEASRKVRARREHTVSRARVDFSFPFRSFPPPFCLFVSSPPISPPPHLTTYLSLSLFYPLHAQLVPTNEGGVQIHLPLYDEERVGERMCIHVEKYDAREFAYISPCTSKITLAHPHLDDDSRLTLGVFEWSAELWKGVYLHNTIEEYRNLDLRNQLARGSAWGFFLTAFPFANPGNEKKGIYPSLTFKANALNPTNKSTPEMVIGGEKIGGSVCETPFPYVTTSADFQVSDIFAKALQSVAPSTTQSPRLLIVDDITCGALPHYCVQRGFRVDVVSESSALNEAGEGAYPGDTNCTRFTGIVDTEPADARKTRGRFAPSTEEGAPVYAAVLFPSLLLDAFQTGEEPKRRLRRADAICERWLIPGVGVRLPRGAPTLTEEVVQFDKSSLYGYSLPIDGLRLAGVEGALLAFGAPCTSPQNAPSAGQLVDTSDEGIAFHGIHAVQLVGDDACSGDASGATLLTTSGVLPPHNKKRKLSEDSGASCTTDHERQTFSGSGSVLPAPERHLSAGVLGAKVEVLPSPSSSSSSSSSSSGGGCEALVLEWSIPTFQSMVGSGDPYLVRSAVACSMYQGVRVRLARKPPTNGQKKKKAAGKTTKTPYS